VLCTPTVDPSPPRPRLTSRDTDTTVHSSRREDISPFSEAPADSATPPAERDEYTKVVWSNEKWKVLTRSKDLFEVDNTPELLSWVRSGPAEASLLVGFRHASTRFNFAKTWVPPLTTEDKPGPYQLTIITGQPVPRSPTSNGTGLTSSPIPEMDEFSLDDTASKRRSTVKSSTTATNRLSTSTDQSSLSFENSSSRSSGGSYFPSHSQRSSSARVRNHRNRQTTANYNEAYNSQMTEAASACWRMVEQVDWSNTKMGPRSSWKADFDGYLSLVFQSPSQDAVWMGEDLNLV
jgi:hypothetical protein